jgi:hypothetical protein
MQNVAETVNSGAQQAMQNLANSFAPVLEKLAGTQSELKLSFNDLTFDTGTVKAKIQGQIMLSAAYTNPNTRATQPKPRQHSEQNSSHQRLNGVRKRD